MAESRFRLTVSPLEGRDNPAPSGFTPQQVFEAIGFVQQTPPVLRYFEDNLATARVGGAGQALLGAADLNRGAAATLAGFQDDALENAAANPAAAGPLNRLAAQAATLIVQANANAVAAEALALRLGTARPVPPPPPPTGQEDPLITPRPDQNPPTGTPVTPINQPSNTPIPPTDGSQLVTTLPSLTQPDFRFVGSEGLRVRDTRVGEGTTATATSRVAIRYRGFLADGGRVFDENFGDEDPLTGTLGPTPTFIQGFAQGIVGMRIGGIRTIDIPSDLAYGEAGTSGVPPNARLVFEVQLLSVS